MARSLLEKCFSMAMRRRGVRPRPFRPEVERLEDIIAPVGDALSVTKVIDDATAGTPPALQT